MPKPQIGETFQSLRPQIGPPTCKVCKATMVPLFTSFYCEACERRAHPQAFDKRYSGRPTLPTTYVTPPRPKPIVPGQVAGIREVWTTKGKALYVTDRSNVPPAWTWGCWVPSYVCAQPRFNMYGDDPTRPFDNRPGGWNNWKAYTESTTLRNFAPPKPIITAALYVI